MHHLYTGGYIYVLYVNLRKITKNYVKLSFFAINR